MTICLPPPPGRYTLSHSGIQWRGVGEDTCTTRGVSPDPRWCPPWRGPASASSTRRNTMLTSDLHAVVAVLAACIVGLLAVAAALVAPRTERIRERVCVALLAYGGLLVAGAFIASHILGILGMTTRVGVTALAALGIVGVGTMAGVILYMWHEWQRYRPYLAFAFALFLAEAAVIPGKTQAGLPPVWVYYTVALGIVSVVIGSASLICIVRDVRRPR
jgi:hypothetical protein